MTEPINETEDCRDGTAPHDFQVEDFSDSEGGEAYERCTKCGKRKN